MRYTSCVLVLCLHLNCAHARLLDGPQRSLQALASRVAARGKQQAIHVLAPKVLEPELPEGHPKIAYGFTWAAGVPEGCITYKDRYSNYSYAKFVAEHGRGWNPNAEIPTSNYTAIMRVHHGLKWTEDLRLMVRAYMVECRNAGLHFWLLHQDTTTETTGNIGTRPTDFLLDCPEEFRPILQTFTAKTLHDAYPQVHLYSDQGARDYLGALAFLHRYSGYRFAWLVEYDVRYTGPDCGAWLNSMLNIGIASMAGRRIDHYTPALKELPHHTARLPDFIDFRNGETLGYIEPLNPQWVPRDADNWRFFHMQTSSANLLGISRLYIDMLHKHSIQGNAGYIEEFLVTLAVEENLSVVNMPFAEWGGHSWHCCLDEGTRYYEDWYTSGECRWYAQIHPMKNRNATIWGPRIDNFSASFE